MERVRSLIPTPVHFYLRRRFHAIRAAVLTLTDHRRFHRHAASAGQPRNLGNDRALIMYYTHSVEKGLSRQDFRPNFGIRPISALAQLMNDWIAGGSAPSDTFFTAACSAMRGYFDRHAGLGVDISEKQDLFSAPVQTLISGAVPTGGVRHISTERPENRSFSELAATRVSMREFSADRVDPTLIEQAVQVALCSPSACNRQSARVHLVTDPVRIDQLLKLQAGLGGYDRPPVLLLITSEASCFVEATERNQPFVDGGLFAMSLLYALEDSGLGSCALTAMLWHKRARAVREILDLPESECLVTFVAVGHKPPESVIPFSRREVASEILKIHGVS